MQLRVLTVGFALTLAALAPVHAQRGPGGTWELLGEQKVGLGVDQDVITVGQSEEWFRNRAYRRLRFVASGGEVRMKSVRLVYLNGHAENLQFEQNLRPNQQIDVDLKGERSYLRQIEMVYKSKIGLSIGGGGIRLDQPSIKVFGENVRPVPPPGPAPAGPGGWQEIARERFDRRDERVEFRVGRREGRIGQIRLRHEGDVIELREIQIRYRNGETQTVNIGQRLEAGETTRPIDLEGDRRVIEHVTVQLDGRRRPGPAELTLLGTERPGRDEHGTGHGGRDSWVLLGEQTVGFRVDRDVIRIGQSEDWFRNRGFDRLHFVAERHDIHMISIRVVYLNGLTEDYPIDRMIQAGRELRVDLQGRRSYLREIEMNYRARPGYGGQAVIRVFGEPPRR